MRRTHINSNLFIGLLLGLCALYISDGWAQVVDQDTQRNGMHSCPLGRFVVGVHVNRNLLLCSDEFGGYSSLVEVIDRSTQVQGMHACPEGMAMTGLHVGKNLLACAPVARPPIARFIDSSTQRSGMHDCPSGNPVSGLHVGRNLLLCGTSNRFNSNNACSEQAKFCLDNCKRRFPPGSYSVTTRRNFEQCKEQCGMDYFKCTH